VHGWHAPLAGGGGLVALGLPERPPRDLRAAVVEIAGDIDALRNMNILLRAEQAEKMVAGMIRTGLTPAAAKKIWDFILPFARYGFNRSHAACYAMIAYQTAYLKARYPAEFMASLLTADHGNVDRIAIEVEECRQMDLEVLPPDINESFSTFTVVYPSLEPRPERGLSVRCEIPLRFASPEDQPLPRSPEAS